jgi:hypothetical protein
MRDNYLVYDLDDDGWGWLLGIRESSDRSWIGRR